MRSSANHGMVGRNFVRIGLILSAAFSCLVLLVPAHAAEGDRRCLICHRAEGLQKPLPDGDKLVLQVDGDTFEKSVHTGIGCAGCHGDIEVGNHPPSRKEIKSARDYALAATEACRGCHADRFTEWEGGVHGALARAGNVRAPLCSGCHNPHGVIKGAAATLDGMPCGRCHQDIAKTYLGSVHARARQKPETSYAPLCSGCHSAHEIKPVVSDAGPRSACVGCHAEVQEKHHAWLPNAGLHLDVVTCPACHVPGAQRQVDLMIYDNQSKQQVAEQHGVPVFEPRAGAAQADETLDALALWRMLTALNPKDNPGKVTLRGRLEVRTGAEAHALGDKSKALSDCNACHREGSDAFQNVTISIAGPDGRRIRQEASPGVLTSVISTGSVGGFYAIGGTRIQLLDILIVLAFLGGIGFAVAHGSMRLAFKRYLLAHPEFAAGAHTGAQTGAHAPDGGDKPA
jgi:Cytochrome c554 and c-prime